MRRRKDEFWRKLKSWIFFHSVGVERDNRNVWHSYLIKRAADKAYIVACTTASACLRHNYGETVGVVLARGYRLHNLTYCGDWRKARVVVDIFKTRVYRTAVIIVKHDHIISETLKDRFDKVKVYRTHLRRKYGITVLEHLFGELGSFIFDRCGFGKNFALSAHFHRCKKAADSDSCRTEVVNLINFKYGI